MRKKDQSTEVRLVIMKQSYYELVSSEAAHCSSPSELLPP